MLMVFLYSMVVDGTQLSIGLGQTVCKISFYPVAYSVNNSDGNPVFSSLRYWCSKTLEFYVAHT